MKRNFFRSRAEKILALIPPSNESDLGSDSEDDVEKNIYKSHNPVIDDDDSSDPPSFATSCENLENIIDEALKHPVEYIAFDLETNELLSDKHLEGVTEPENFFTDVLANSVLINEPPLNLSSAPPEISNETNPSSSPTVQNLKAETISSTSITSFTKKNTRSQKKEASTKEKLKKVNQPKKLEVIWTEDNFAFKAEIPENGKPPLPSTTVKTPYEYFCLFFTECIYDLIVSNTNLYSMQQIGKSINVTKNDIKDFIAIELLMGVIKLPSYCDYWSHNLRYSKIADIMTLKRYQQIRRFLHFVNNEEVNDDRYFKIRPFVDIIRSNCLSVPHERRFSIDEMMVPYKGTMAGSRRQYIKNKPKKWGFKIFVRAGIGGFVYDFLLYSGEDTFRQIDFSEEEKQFGLGAKVVIALSKTIVNPACSVVYFDNFFSSFELVVYLRQNMGIFSLGTLRNNRIKDCKLEDDKSMKKRGRGSFCQQVSNEQDAKVAVVKWLDNKTVILVSSFTDAYPISTVKRYKKEDKKRVDVNCPQIVREYNRHMGGVDLADMFVALYRTGMKTKRWYLGIFSQLLDICVNNAWILYKEDLGRNSKEPKKKTALKDFRIMIAEVLLQKNRIRGRPSNLLKSTENRPNRSPVTVKPCIDTQFDLYGHLPVFLEARGRCKLCIKNQSFVSCSKCKVRLCLQQTRNCFYDFHQNSK